MARLRIVGSYLSPYVRKVLACLDLKGIDYEIDPIVPFYGDDRFSRLSPLRRIPVLIEGDLVLTMDRWNEFSPCQNGGIVAYIHEHGTDSGCGDNNWPKTVGFLAGWGYGHATLNGKPLYQDYEMHFMVTQGLRDRKTLKVNYPLANKRLPGGETNPATQQIDFYIRSPQQNARNKPNRQVFVHFFGMEVTWK